MNQKEANDNINRGDTIIVGLFLILENVWFRTKPGSLSTLRNSILCPSSGGWTAYTVPITLRANRFHPEPHILKKESYHMVSPQIMLS
jgi:hypothetical protein